MQQLFDLAHQDLDQGYYAKAIKESEEGYRQAGKDLFWSWKFRVIEAEALMRDYRFKESIDLLKDNPPAELPVDLRVHKRTVESQALCRSDHIKEGAAVLKEAANMASADSPLLQADLDFALGFCSFPDYALAREYFRKAAQFAGPNAPYIAASSLGNIGHLLSQEDKQGEAIEWYEKAMPRVRATGSAVLEEKLLGNLGNSYSNLGDFKRAIENSEKAQAIADRIGRRDDEESWLVTLGRSYAALPGDYPDKAEHSYLQALAIATDRKSEDTINRCLHNLAQLAIKEHNLGKAKQYWNREAARVPHNSAAEVDAALDEAEIAFAETNLGKAQDISGWIVRNPKTSLTRRAVAQGLMGKIYALRKNPAEANRMFQQGIQTVEKLLSQNREEYRVSLLDEHSLLFDSYIIFLAAQGQRIAALREAEHVRELAQDAHFNTGKTALNIASIQSSLKGRNQVVLDYQVTDEKSFLWLITASNFQMFELPSHMELHKLIEGHNAAIYDHRSIEDSPDGQALYRALVQPAEKFIPKGAHVSIVPSKLLWILNFETLIVPGGNPHYWIEDIIAQNASSLARAAQSSVPRESNERELLLIGAPEQVDPNFKTLQFAPDEIDRIKTQFPSAKLQVISGAGATPAAYKESNPRQYRFIHFVTHGIPNEKVPMESAIVLSGAAGSYKLYARDIISIPLRADLVTISACYGAGKRWYVSEGMVGLGWAFMRAGAHQVIAALWEVDDASTPALMDDFYRELTHHRATADALRDAKLAMLRSDSRKRPYYWGSLQLYMGS